jgi:hypothetical protein
MDMSFATRSLEAEVDAVPDAGMQPLLLVSILFSPLFWIVLLWSLLR